MTIEEESNLNAAETGTTTDRTRATTSPESMPEAPEAAVKFASNNHNGDGNGVGVGVGDSSKKQQEQPSQPPKTSQTTKTTTSQSQQQQRKKRTKTQSKLDEMMELTGGRLSVRNAVNFDIPTNQGAKQHVEGVHGETSWRAAILRLLHSHKTQMILMCLLLLDVVVLFVEIFLLASYPPCSIIERDCIACCSSSDGTDGTDDDHANLLRFLAGDAGHGDICEPGYDSSSGMSACDGHKYHKIHTLEKVLFSFTIIILSVFLIELNAEMIALGPKVFFRQFFYSLDYIIVLVSLSLELFFKLASQEALQTLVGLIVFGRVWRFIRIGHGIVEITSEYSHMQYQDMEKYAKSMEEILIQHKIELPESHVSLHGTEH